MPHQLADHGIQARIIIWKGPLWKLGQNATAGEDIPITIVNGAAQANTLGYRIRRLDLLYTRNVLVERLKGVLLVWHQYPGVRILQIMVNAMLCLDAVW